MQTNWLSLARKKTSIMTFLKIHNIAIVEGTHLERWLHAKTHSVKENGSIQCAFKRRTYLRSGIVLTARSKETRRKIQIHVDIL